MIDWIQSEAESISEQTGYNFNRDQFSSGGLRSVEWKINKVHGWPKKREKSPALEIEEFFLISHFSSSFTLFFSWFF